MKRAAVVVVFLLISLYEISFLWSLAPSSGLPALLSALTLDPKHEDEELGPHEESELEQAQWRTVMDLLTRLEEDYAACVQDQDRFVREFKQSIGEAAMSSVQVDQYGASVCFQVMEGMLKDLQPVWESVSHDGEQRRLVQRIGTAISDVMEHFIFPYLPWEEGEYAQEVTMCFDPQVFFLRRDLAWKRVFYYLNHDGLVQDKGLQFLKQVYQDPQKCRGYERYVSRIAIAHYPQLVHFYDAQLAAFMPQLVMVELKEGEELVKILVRAIRAEMEYAYAHSNPGNRKKVNNAMTVLLDLIFYQKFLEEDGTWPSAVPGAEDVMRLISEHEHWETTASGMGGFKPQGYQRLEEIMGNVYRDEQKRCQDVRQSHQDMQRLEGVFERLKRSDPFYMRGVLSFEHLLELLEREEGGLGQRWLVGSVDDLNELGEGDIVDQKAWMERCWEIFKFVVFDEDVFPPQSDWPYAQELSQRFFKLMDQHMEKIFSGDFDLFDILEEELERLPYSYFMPRFVSYYFYRGCRESLSSTITEKLLQTLIMYSRLELSSLSQTIPSYIWIKQGDRCVIVRKRDLQEGAFQEVSSLEMIAHILKRIGQSDQELLFDAYRHVWQQQGDDLSPQFMAQLRQVLQMKLSPAQRRAIGARLHLCLQQLAQVEGGEPEMAAAFYSGALSQIRVMIQNIQIVGIRLREFDQLAKRIIGKRAALENQLGDATGASGMTACTSHLTPAGTGPVQWVEGGLIELRTDAAGQLQAVADWSHPVLRWLKPLSDKGLLEPNFTYVIQVVRNSLPLAYTVAGQEAGRATIYVHERVLAHAENVVMQEIAYKECVWRSAEQAKQLTAVRSLGPAVAEAEFGDNWFQYGLRIVSNRSFLEAFQVSGEQFLAAMGELYRQGVLLQEYEGRSLQESDLGASGFYTLVVRPDGVQQLLDSYELQQDTLWRAA